MPIDLIEFGRVLGRLDAQDRELAALRELLAAQNAQIDRLLEIANRSKGGIAVLMTVGMAVSTVIGWALGHWWK